MAQEVYKTDLTVLDDHPAQMAIDSIWHQVRIWKADTTAVYQKHRHDYVLQLEAFYERTKNNKDQRPAHRAIEFVFRILAENKNYERIINKFELGDFDPVIWRKCYSFYQSAVLRSPKHFSIYGRLRQSIPQVKPSVKPLIYEKIAGGYYAAGRADSASYYYNLILRDTNSVDFVLNSAKSNLYAIDSLKVGVAAPQFVGIDMKGNEIKLADYKGKVVLLEFFTTRCKPCLKALPKLQELYADHHDDGFELIAISLDREQERVATFIEKKELSWTVICDEAGGKGEIPERYKVGPIPTYFVVDQNGIIQHNYLMTKKNQQLEELIPRLLGKTTDEKTNGKN